MATIKRLQAEFNDITKNPICNYSVNIVEDDIYHWIAKIKGAKDSPYEGGVFLLNINFPNNYPFKPPKISFVTKIYHCNIDLDGVICLDILSEKWSPALTVSKVLLSIISLLDDPNPDDPLILSIGKLYKENKEKYHEKARNYTIQYANNNDF